MVKTNWFKRGVIIVLGVFLLGKDISFQLSVGNPSKNSFTVTRPPQEDAPKALPTSNVTAVPTSEKEVEIAVELEKTVNAPKESEGAKRFSNLGFVLNPTYARRHNIDPQIVAAKRQIVDGYVRRFVDVAQAEMLRYRIPASITLAQGLLESDAGGSRLARQNNNHFGIKCFSKTCTKGHCANFTDDSHKDFFRVYTSAWESYRAHSIFLHQKRYKHLLELPITNYKDWARGLQKAGYATDKAYAQKLIYLIEALDLMQYDRN